GRRRRPSSPRRPWRTPCRPTPPRASPGAPPGRGRARPASAPAPARPLAIRRPQGPVGRRWRALASSASPPPPDPGPHPRTTMINADRGSLLRRTTPVAAGALLLAGLAAPASAVVEEESLELTLLATTDVHGH